jgi:endonuclease/exonuclease/phosphatase (EEP) superfamily protein YafD
MVREQRVKRILRRAFGSKRQWPLRAATTGLVLWLVVAVSSNSSNYVGIAASALGPWSCVLAFLLCGLAFALKQRRLGALLVILVLATGIGYHVVPLGPLKTESGAKKHLTILQLNTLLDSASPTAVARLVKSQNVDFAVLAETTASFRPWHNHRIEALLPHHFAVDASYPSLGNTIYSRWPILHRWTIPGTTNPTLAIQVKVSGEQVTLVGLRMENPLVNRLKWASDLNTISAWAQSHRKTKNLIVAGDFNATIGQAPFDSLLKRTKLTESASLVNWPWARATFPTKPWNTPLIQIDHTLTSRQVSVQWVKTFYVRNTDHAATISRLGITAK